MLKTVLRIIGGLAALGFILWELKAVRFLAGGLPWFDFLYEKYRDPSWIGVGFRMLASPPPGMTLTVMAAALTLIYWTTKPQHKRMTAPAIGMVLCAIGGAGCLFWFLYDRYLGEPDSSAPPPSVTVAPELVTSPLQASINGFLAKRGKAANYTSLPGMNIVIRDDKDDTGPYISRWDITALGPWPTVADGFTRLQLRSAPIPVATTAAVDIPAKIAALDQALAIFQKELPQWINQGYGLSTGGWWNLSVGGKEAELGEKLTDWNQAYNRIFDALEAVGKDSLKFPDVVDLSSPPFRESLNKKVFKFVHSAGLSIAGGKWHQEALKYFIEPVGQATYADLQRIEEWRARSERQALEIRQQLSR